MIETNRGDLLAGLLSYGWTTSSAVSIDGHSGFVHNLTPSNNAAANILAPGSLCLCPSISGKEFSRCGTAGKRCRWI